MNLVFEEFLRTSIPPLISVLYAKGYHDSPLKNFLSHSAQKICRGTFLGFRKFMVSKNVRDKRGGGHHDFPSKLICLTLLNLFIGEPFYVSQKFSCRKVLCLRGLCHNFLSKCFCLAVRKNFVGEPVCVSQNFKYPKTLSLRGLCHDFPSNLFCLTVPKNFVGELLGAVFQKISGGEKFFG